MYKLDLKKADKPEVKLPTSIGSQKKQENSRKTSTSASLTTLKPLTVQIRTNSGKILKRDGNTRPLYLPPEKPVSRSRSNSQNWIWNSRLVPNSERSMSGGILSSCLSNLCAEYIMRNAGLDEAQAGISLPGEISIPSDMQMTPPLWQKVKKN